MKPKKLKKISNKKYSVKECCIYKGDKKICNFWIQNITINEQADEEVSFTIELESKKEVCEATLPIIYLYDPSGWLHLGFDVEDFYPKVSRAEFDKSMNEIMGLLVNDEECVHEDLISGWCDETIADSALNISQKFSFHKFEDPTDVVSLEVKEQPVNYLCEYQKFVDESIALPLFSYMLLSILSYFDLLGKNIRPDFIMTLTGGDERLRRKTALFFTNLYKRNLSFGRLDYKPFHILNTDSFAEMFFKTRAVKDCVVIALEPDLKHLKFLINSIYGIRSIDKKHPVRNMCLVTTKEIGNIDAKVINIQLPEEYHMNELDEYFRIEDVFYERGIDIKEPIFGDEDKLMDSIYYYIDALRGKVIENREYVNDEFKKFTRIYRDLMKNTDFPGESYEAAVLLSFGYYMYIGEYLGGIDEEWKKYAIIKRLTAIQIITKTVVNSYWTKGSSSGNDFEKAKKVCCSIDSYFDNEKKESRIRSLDKTDNAEDVRAWYNEKYIYIKAENIKEFLKLTQCKESFSVGVRKAMAENGIILTYTKKDNKLEYSARLPKVIGKNRPRCIAFDREACKRYNLFDKIEAWILKQKEEDAQNAAPDENSD